MRLQRFLSRFTALALAGLAAAAPRQTPPAGAIVVAPSGGDFTTLQAAVNSIKSSTSASTIFIKPGTYSGQTYIPALAAALTIQGSTPDHLDYSRNTVTLTHSLSAAAAGSNDLSATLRAWTPKLKVYNLNIANTYGQGSQALALAANAERQGYYGCKLIGYQDTVYVNKPHQVFKDSYIEGAVDFIFGNDGNVWFEGCDIAINGKGYITASGRDTADAFWYVINGATISVKSGVSLASGASVLGRPWREYARVVVQNSMISKVIAPAGWSAWGSNPTGNVYYAEYGNQGDGAKGPRITWAKTLSAPKKIDEVIPDWKSWVDQDYWNA
ncbi:hypothetical protein ACHAQH_000929 [Verticillium albo-atrum]